MRRLLLVQGPNLNLLGTREPAIYGAETLEAVHRRLHQEALGLNLELECFQSNHEGAIVERIHRAGAEGVDYILINPAAYTHTSVAIRDALAAVAVPFIEVHLSNVHRREPFRHHSYLSDLAVGVIVGLGSQGYSLALMAAATQLSRAVSLPADASLPLREGRESFSGGPGEAPERTHRR
ncbi:MAG: type II 3-dehydroquinate dehydratase [Betaproteobacteria bacterium]|nr:type II 3-dehydroquinate dehydratase [Betaproteobacteria bacterium]